MPPGCFGYLPVELFRIGPRFFAFDAGSVFFMEVDRISQGDEAPFLKSCRVGHGFNAVLPGGDIAVCAEATSHVIGNVNVGSWYFDRISEMNRRLHQDWQDCSRCFVGRFCRLCWQKVPGGGEAWRNGRMRFCRFTREYYLAVFDCMLRVLARNPALWDDLARAVGEKISEIRAEQLSSSSPPS